MGHEILFFFAVFPLQGNHQIPLPRHFFNEQRNRSVEKERFYIFTARVSVDYLPVKVHNRTVSSIVRAKKVLNFEKKKSLANKGRSTSVVDQLGERNML